MPLPFGEIYWSKGDINQQTNMQHEYITDDFSLSSIELLVQLRKAFRGNIPQCQDIARILSLRSTGFQHVRREE